MGDFNLSCITWDLVGKKCIALHYEGNCVQDLLDNLNLIDLNQRNNIKNKFNKTLDLVISNLDLIIHKSSNILVTEDDYHPALVFTIDSSDVKFLKAIKSPKRNFRKGNYEGINHDLNLINWNNELKSEDVDNSVDSFYQIINRIIDGHVPLTKPKDDSFPIWFSAKLIETRRRLGYG